MDKITYERDIEGNSRESTKIGFEFESDLNIKEFSLNENEMKILRKIFEWPKIIETASFKYEPHKIPYYLYELATLFHAYWSKGNEDQKYKFIEGSKIKKNETLAIIVLVAIVIQRGMNILGVSLPTKM